MAIKVLPEKSKCRRMLYARKPPVLL
jgi:hypothetical protein